MGLLHVQIESKHGPCATFAEFFGACGLTTIYLITKCTFFKIGDSDLKKPLLLSGPTAVSAQLCQEIA